MAIFRQIWSHCFAMYFWSLNWAGWLAGGGQRIANTFFKRDPSNDLFQAEKGLCFNNFCLIDSRILFFKKPSSANFSFRLNFQSNLTTIHWNDTHIVVSWKKNRCCPIVIAYQGANSWPGRSIPLCRVKFRYHLAIKAIFLRWF